MRYLLFCKKSELSREAIFIQVQITSFFECVYVSYLTEILVYYYCIICILIYADILYVLNIRKQV
jgi:hypothetical protein